MCVVMAIAAHTLNIHYEVLPLCIDSLAPWSLLPGTLVSGKATWGDQADNTYQTSGLYCNINPYHSNVTAYIT